MDEIDDYVFKHLPIEGVTNIVTNYNATLIGFFKSEYNKYYNQHFRGSEEQHINDSFFRVLDKCSEFVFTITITANGVPQTLKQFKEQNKEHRKLQRLIQSEQETGPEYNEWKNNEQEKIKLYNETLKITISYPAEDSCVLYLTNTNWDQYKEEEKRYKNLLFIGPVTTVGNFLVGLIRLISVDFTGLTRLTTVGGYFLYNCDSLVTIDFTGLTRLTTVGGYFLYNCNSLVSIDFRGLTQLTTVGAFLNVCNSLVSIDFRGLTQLKLTTVGGFLTSCENLVSVDFRGLISLTTISGNFLGGCNNLVSIDFTGLTSLTTVGGYFLCRCSNLVIIDFTGLTRLTTVGGCLTSCENLVSVDFRGLISLTTIRGAFLNVCNSLVSIDFRGLTQLTTVGGCLTSCENLVSVDFRGLISLTTISGDFLGGCNNLVSIDFTGLTSLTTVGGYFLCKCPNLVIIDFTGLTRLTTVGGYFLYNCDKLVTVDFTGLTYLTTVGDYFLYNCDKLVTVDFTGLNQLTTVGYYWLYECHKLKNVFISQTLSNDLKNKLPIYLQMVDSTINSLPYNEFKFCNIPYNEYIHFLSNSYIDKKGILIRGDKWLNIEHYIQTMKFRGKKATPRMIEYSNIIKNITNNSKSINWTDLQVLGLRKMDDRKKFKLKKDKLLKDIIHNYKDINIREDWDLAYVVVIIDALYHKFNQKSLKKEIMKIPDNTYIVDGSDVTKDNKLGKILTAFINVIRYGDCSKISKELLLKIKYS